MSWREMQYTFASVYAGELAEVAKVGGPQALQEKVARISVDDRRLLRRAMDELPRE